jgi:hypothetical protein
MADDESLPLAKWRLTRLRIVTLGNQAKGRRRTLLHRPTQYGVTFRSIARPEAEWWPSNHAPRLTDWRPGAGHRTSRWCGWCTARVGRQTLLAQQGRLRLLFAAAALIRARPSGYHRIQALAVRAGA